MSDEEKKARDEQEVKSEEPTAPPELEEPPGPEEPPELEEPSEPEGPPERTAPEELTSPEPGARRPRPEPARFQPATIRSLPVWSQLVVLFCLLVNIYAGWHFYTPLHDNGWGDFDDHTWRRDAAQRNTLATIFHPTLTTDHEAMDTSYVPVQSLIYHWSINVTEQGPFPIRVLGIWLHIINACLLMVLAFRFTGSIPAAHLSALAFLLFPRNAYTIGWLCASLAHGLVWALYLAAFVVIQTGLHRRSWWRFAFGALFFLLAVLTKELSATLFGAVVLYDVIVVMGIRKLWPPKLKVYLGLLARHGALLAILIGAIVIQKLKYEGGFVNTKFGGMEFGWRNLMRLLELSTLLTHWGPSWPREQVLLAMGAIAAGFFAALYLVRRKPVLLFLVLWLPVVLTPFTISNFRDIHTLGRYVYEGSGVLILIVTILAVRLVRWKRFLTWPVLCGALLLLGNFAFIVQRVTR